MADFVGETPPGLMDARARLVGRSTIISEDLPMVNLAGHEGLVEKVYGNFSCIIRVAEISWMAKVSVIVGIANVEFIGADSFHYFMHDFTQIKKHYEEELTTFGKDTLGKILIGMPIL